MESRSSSGELHSPKSSISLYSFENGLYDGQSLSSHSDDNNSKYETLYNRNSASSSAYDSPISNDSVPEENTLEEHRNGSPFNQFNTTSMDIPEFDHDLLQTEYMSQNIFDQNDNESVQSDPRDDCEIVNIVHSGSSNNSSITMEALTRFNAYSSQNGSTSNPILVDDSLNSSVDASTHDQNANDSTGNDSNVPENRNNYTQNGSAFLPTPSLSNVSSPPFNRSNSREQDNDDCIMGPIHWGNKRPPQFPLDYYRSNKNFSNAYKFLDTEAPGELNTLEDIEFLFKCPICYSTITRLRSGKVPNENDKVIYSTKCGHLFCYECIESVKSRKECSICRKPLRDKYQYHVVFP